MTDNIEHCEIECERPAQAPVRFPCTLKSGFTNRMINSNNCWRDFNVLWSVREKMLEDIKLKGKNSLFCEEDIPYLDPNDWENTDLSCAELRAE